MLRPQPEVVSVFSRVRVGNATVSATLKERAERERTSHDFERAAAPLLNRIPDARVFFRSQQTGGRALNLMLGGDDPAVLNQAALQLVEQMATLPELVAPRISGDLQRPEITITAAARPRRRPRRHHRGAEPGDPHRDPGRDRPEQRPLLAVRPPDPDPRRAQRECAPAASSTIENLPVPTADRRLGAAQGRRRHQLRRRPDS